MAWRWFSRRVPLDLWERTWVESSLLWITSSVGAELLAKAPRFEQVGQWAQQTLPLGPAHSAPLEEYSRKLAVSLGIDRPVVLQWHPSWSSSSRAEGLDAAPGNRSSIAGRPQPDVSLGEGKGNGLRSREPAVARPPCVLEVPWHRDSSLIWVTLAIELAREALAGQEPWHAHHDPTWTWELTAVLWGLGPLFCHAQPERQETYRFAREARHPLAGRKLGYALALRDWLWGEGSTRLVRHLRPDAADVYRKARRWLDQGDVCVDREALCRDVALHQWSDPIPLQSALERPGSSARLLALWRLAEGRLRLPGLESGLESCLRDKEPSIQAAALQLLGKQIEWGDCLVQGSWQRWLTESLTSRHDEVRTAAMGVLGAIDQESSRVEDWRVSALCRGLADPSPQVVLAAARGVALNPSLGQTPLLSSLLAAMRRALIDCQTDELHGVIDAVYALCDDPTEAILEFFDARDPELRAVAVESIVAYRKRIAADDFS